VCSSDLQGQRLIWRVALVCVLGAVALLSFYRTVARNLDWRNDVVFLSRTLADSPKAYRLHNLLGLAYWQKGDEGGAEQEWRKVLEFDPNYASALNNLGTLYAKQKRYAEAASLFQRAVELEPNYVFPHLNLGLIYAEQGQMAAAERNLRAAVVLAPLNFEIHNVLGKLYLDSNRLAEAEDQFRQSLAGEPNLAAYDNLGFICLRRNDYGRAEKLFKMALSLSAADTRARGHLGTVYAATGRLAEARREFELVLAADPKNEEARSALEKLASGSPAANSPLR
jgi:Flp pilus assembly protein TadD